MNLRLEIFMIGLAQKFLSGVRALKWMRWGIRAIVFVAVIHLIFFLYMLIGMATR